MADTYTRSQVDELLKTITTTIDEKIKKIIILSEEEPPAKDTQMWMQILDEDTV